MGTFVHNLYKQEQGFWVFDKCQNQRNLVSRAWTDIISYHIISHHITSYPVQTHFLFTLNKKSLPLQPFNKSGDT